MSSPPLDGAVMQREIAAILASHNEKDEVLHTSEEERRGEERRGEERREIEADRYDISDANLTTTIAFCVRAPSSLLVTLFVRLVE